MEYDTKDYPDQNLLAKDVSMRIIDITESTGALYSSLSHAPTISANDTVKNGSELILDNNEFVKRALEAEQQQVTQQDNAPIRLINAASFKAFNNDLFKIWLQTKDQISLNQWAIISIKGQNYSLKDVIKEYLLNQSWGEQNHRFGLHLATLYFETLANCGLMDLTRQTQRKGGGK